MAAALLVILLLVFLSVFYPALQASKIPPALALKEE
jgi:ABC-type lipoprotein release transport system permease subunit